MLVGVDAGTGELLKGREIAATDDGHRDALRWALDVDSDRVWAIEDCRYVSRRLEQALLAAGERVVRVPPKMMGQSRRAERQTGKSDEIDALAVARAVVKDGADERSRPQPSVADQWRGVCPDPINTEPANRI